MFDLMLSVSNAISDVVMIGWVWATMGVLVWLGVIFLAMLGEPSHRREDAAVAGSLIGAVMGFISPILLSLLPFLLPVILIVVVLACVGLAISHFSKVGK